MVIYTLRFPAAPMEETANAIESAFDFFTFIAAEMVHFLRIFLRWLMLYEPASAFYADVHHYHQNPQQFSSQPRMHQISSIGWITSFLYPFPFCSQRWNFPEGEFPGPRMSEQNYHANRKVIMNYWSAFLRLNLISYTF